MEIIVTYAMLGVIASQEKVRKRKCKQCGKLFVQDNEFQGFCSEDCYQVFAWRRRK
ncbi:hypothetical protein IBX38_06055 [Candidatus Bathyarchaeota archaeon]|nr:hypothetical protein [Candidatus Bathyarchaeota archaeon]